VIPKEKHDNRLSNLIQQRRICLAGGSEAIVIVSFSKERDEN